MGGLAVAVCAFFLKAAPPLGSDPTKRSRKDILQQTLRMDWIGGVLIVAAVVSAAFSTSVDIFLISVL